MFVGKTAPHVRDKSRDDCVAELNWQRVMSAQNQNHVADDEQNQSENESRAEDFVGVNLF